MNVIGSILALSLAASSIAQQDGAIILSADAPPPTAAIPVEGSSPDNRPILWQNIRLGMTRAEVQALYPTGNHVHHRDAFTEIDEFAVVGNCEAEVNIHHEQGMVDRIVINGGGSMGGRCSDTVLTALSSRYGQPLAESRTEGSILAREGRIYVWNRDGITLRFKRFSNGIFAGGGLGAASWELTYSGVTDNVAL